MASLLPIVLVALAGVVMSGYMSLEKYVNDMCITTNQPCPEFLGYPACYFGCACFVVVLVLALAGKRQAVNKLAVFGAAFAAYFTFSEFMSPFGVLGGGFGISPCAWGMLLFGLIGWLSRK